MMLKPQDSRCSPRDLNLAEAIVNNAGDRQQLLDWAHALWPRLQVYCGDTHWRFLLTGDSQGDSFYVDLSDPVPTASRERLHAEEVRRIERENPARAAMFNNRGITSNQ